MATRTITREVHNSRVVLVWPKGVTPDDVKENSDGNQYARVDGKLVQPVALDVDKFKAAFGFVPTSGSKNTYEMGREKPPVSAEQQLLAGIKGLIAEANA